MHMFRFVPGEAERRAPSWRDAGAKEDQGDFHSYLQFSLKPSYCIPIFSDPSCPRRRTLSLRVCPSSSNSWERLMPPAGMARSTRARPAGRWRSSGRRRWWRTSATTPRSSSSHTVQICGGKLSLQFFYIQGNIMIKEDISRMSEERLNKAYPCQYCGMSFAQNWLLKRSSSLFEHIILRIFLSRSSLTRLPIAMHCSGIGRRTRGTNLSSAPSATEPSLSGFNL